MNKIYLILREDNVVVEAYVAKKAKAKQHAAYQEIELNEEDLLEDYNNAFKGVEVKTISELLAIKDSDGKYNLKHEDGILMQLCANEKTEANKTEADEALDELQDTDYKIINAMEQFLEKNTDDAELIELISKRKAARTKINEVG